MSRPCRAKGGEEGLEEAVAAAAVAAVAAEGGSAKEGARRASLDSEAVAAAKHAPPKILMAGGLTL